MSLGHRVRHYRDKLGWTLEVLAEKSEVDVGTISALENRDSKRSQYTGALASAFGLTVEQLLDESRDWLAKPAHSGARLVAMERSVSYDPNPWPLQGITPKQYFEQLSDADRSEVIGFIKGLLKSRQAKRPAA